MKKINILIYMFALVVIYLWIYDSYDYGKPIVFSQDSKIISAKIYDELFDTETISTETIDGSWIGLFPGDDTISLSSFYSLSSLLGIAIFFRIITFYINRRKKD
jgi:hypothetical protein